MYSHPQILRMTIHLNSTMTGRIQSHQLAEPLFTNGSNHIIYSLFKYKQNLTWLGDIYEMLLK